MKILIGTLVITAAVFIFCVNKPSGMRIKGMFGAILVFGFLVATGSMSFTSRTNVALSTLIIIGLLLMELCFYGEIVAQKKRLEAAKAVPVKAVEASKPVKTKNEAKLPRLMRDVKVSPAS
ncbi:MAG: hypothetical protein LBS74_08955 [Oscillospiraceae bacterium]|nr:hypothetical protein [Oscillospiraceae bacterium]